MILTVNKNLAYNVKIERNKRLLTQEQLAEMADISVKHVVMIENGKVSPSLNVVASIAKVLNVSIDILIADINL